MYKTVHKQIILIEEHVIQFGSKKHENFESLST